MTANCHHNQSRQVTAASSAGSDFDSNSCGEPRNSGPLQPSRQVSYGHRRAGCLVTESQQCPLNSNWVKIQLIEQEGIRVDDTKSKRRKRGVRKIVRVERDQYLTPSCNRCG